MKGDLTRQSPLIELAVSRSFLNLANHVTYVGSSWARKGEFSLIFAELDVLLIYVLVATLLTSSVLAAV